MSNLVYANYAQTGKSSAVNELGMREMQQRAFNSRHSQYLLLKAPPASGKSRALMFIALDKLHNQNIKKIIVTVPERAIGGSFMATDLKSYGFFANWQPNDEYNLCIQGLDNSGKKVEAFKNFMSNEEPIMICTHATLRFACEELETTIFNDTLIAIDEFHHISADNSSKLGELLRNIMQKSTAHIIAMTGSYFRGDGIAVLSPEDEAKFDKVTYNYYDQLNGYIHLKSLGIGYHFYQGRYTNVIMEVLDTDKKTILHIPSVNSGESTKDKYNEVDLIISQIGELEYIDPNTQVLYVKRHHDGKIIKVADLVNDEESKRNKIMQYLRNIKSSNDIDLIIALGMAKEGFDWPCCEHVLTVGYRGSLTEIIQIIGRATRDSENKSHAQFTNLIAQPDAADSQVKIAVNNMLKAITASLLMEQVLAPNFKFTTKISSDDTSEENTIKIRGFKMPSSDKVKNIIETDLNDLKATILQDQQMLKAMPGNIHPEIINRVLIPKIIQMKYPDLSDQEIEEVRQHVVTDAVVKNGTIIKEGDKRFLKMAHSFINIDDLNIDLIDTINPFQKAFEILSKSVTSQVFKLIKEAIDAIKIDMSEEEARLLAPKFKQFRQTMGQDPDINSNDPLEVRLAEFQIYMRNYARRKAQKAANSQDNNQNG
jgi:superfamily II DNA or RNA helicase